MNSKQLRELVHETLQYLDPVIPYSSQAEDLVLMTIAHESSNGEYIKQLNGPALGICQMEPRTHDDIHENFLQFKPELNFMVGMLSGFSSTAETLVWDLKYAIAMCRVHYYRVPEALPSSLEGLALYAKEHYNTHLGKATSEDYLLAYQRHYKGE